MTEGLAAQISSIVRQHLADAHRMLGALLAQLDAGGEVDLGGRAATSEPTKPAVAAPSPKPSTLERKQRLSRAKARAATGAAAPVTAAPADPWPALRIEFHAAIKARHLPRARVAADLGVSKGSIAGWLLPHSPPPSAANLAKIGRWLSPRSATLPAPPETAEAPLDGVAEDGPTLVPPYRLREDQRDQLAGFVQLTDARELRRTLGLTETLIGQAIGGPRVAARGLGANHRLPRQRRRGRMSAHRGRWSSPGAHRRRLLG